MWRTPSLLFSFAFKDVCGNTIEATVDIGTSIKLLIFDDAL